MEINLSTLNKRSESETLEFKESFDKKALETIGAFANSSGGTILIGVRDDGHVTGIVIGNNTLEDWTQRMQSNIQPRILPSIVKRDHNGRTIVAITVDQANDPVSVDGRFIKRVGRTNQQMSPEEIKQRLIASSGTSWDAQVVSEATMSDLDQDAVKRFISLVKATGRRPVGERGEDEILSKLELVKNGVPTRAAILLFGNSPRRFFMSSLIQLGRFRSETQIVDDKRNEGNILEQIDECLTWCKQRFETELVITGKPERDEKWEYPLEAVREALINAVCHREYAALSNTQVRLYDDRIEIWNPGGLLMPLTPEQLLQEHPSLRRNPLIANSLFYAGYIESWGSGTLRIAKLAQEANLEVPEFRSQPSEFRIILRKRVLTEAALEKMGLSVRQIAAVLHVVKAERITNREYQDLWTVSRATAQRELSHLVEKGILTKHGKTGQNVFYTLIEVSQ